MSHKFHYICLKVSLIAVFLLLLQFSYAQKQFAPLDNWLHQNVNELGGRAVLVIWKDGKVIYNQAENEMSRRQKMMGKMIARRKGKDADEVLQDYSSATRLRIASSSKWLTAALVMTFVDEGKLSIYDTIGKFLPVMSANGKGNITIWQCLSHTTGIKTESLKNELEGLKNIITMQEAMHEIATLPMEGEPGKIFHYGNSGLQIAAAICEVIGKDNFENLFQRKIAQPLGMKQTDFGNSKVPLAAGGAWSTADDYMHFLVMILQKGKYNGKQILSENSIMEMQKNWSKDATIIYSPAEANKFAGYGFGEWVNEEDNGKSTGVTSPGLFGSFPWVDLKRNYAGFLMVFTIKNNGRGELYHSLKVAVDKALAQ